MDIGKTMNATGRTMPAWRSPLRILAILLPLAAGLVCSFIDQSLLLVSWILRGSSPWELWLPNTPYGQAVRVVRLAVRHPGRR